jgi:hypothetical protein
MRREEVENAHHRRWLHEDVIERHRQRMKEAAALMRRRGSLVEHPFGTLKCRAGYRHFLVRGFDKVRGEWNLMALCYNFGRLLNILGLDRFIAYLASKRAAQLGIFFILSIVAPVMARARPLITRTWFGFRNNDTPSRLCFRPAE